MVPVFVDAIRAHARPSTVSNPSSVLTLWISTRILAPPPSSSMTKDDGQESPIVTGFPGRSGKKTLKPGATLRGPLTSW